MVIWVIFALGVPALIGLLWLAAVQIYLAVCERHEDREAYRLWKCSRSIHRAFGRETGLRNRAAVAVLDAQFDVWKAEAIRREIAR